MSIRLPQLFTILPTKPFGLELAQGILQRVGHDPLLLSNVTLYLPNRRSCATMMRVFQELSAHKTTLLPRIMPIGDIAEDTIFETDADLIQEAPDILPAIDPLERQMLLMRLLMARQDYILKPAQAFDLAGELAQLMDRAYNENVTFDKFDSLVTGDLAEHWQKTVDFLSIITAVWPRILKERQALDPAQQRHILLSKKAEAYRRQQPQNLVIAAGSTGSITATAELLDVIARLPNGMVVLPGLDPSLPQQHWDTIDITHPYYTMKNLLAYMDVDRGIIRQWVADPKVQTPLAKPQEKNLITLIHHAFQPQQEFDLEQAVLDPEHLKNMHFYACDHLEHEARTISLLLRETLQYPDKTALVVTPDKDLAQRIQNDMLRWGIRIDYSGGETLDKTVTGVFVSLVSRLWCSDKKITALLDVLYHPMCRIKSAEQIFSSQEKERFSHELILDKISYETLISDSVVFADPVSESLRLELKKFLEKIDHHDKTLAGWIDDHVSYIHFLTGHDENDATLTVWDDICGTKLADLLKNLYYDPNSTQITCSAAAYCDFIARAMANITVRDPHGYHPRLAILSPIEARLQTADTMILAGLNDTIWPPESLPSVWLSRGMQLEIGFDLPEKRIGQSALDFLNLMCHSDVHMTYSSTRGGVVAQPSLWLQHIFAVMKKNNHDPDMIHSPYLHWAKEWFTPDHYITENAPVANPPVSARPKAISVTDVDLLIADAYSYYAKNILKLRPLDMIDISATARDWGNAAHDFLNRLHDLTKNGIAFSTPDLISAVLTRYELSPRTKNRWQTRLSVLAEWSQKYYEQYPVSYTESEGAAFFYPDINPQGFYLKGRADYIAISQTHVIIHDYKTSTTFPKQAAIAQGKNIQLPLLAYMVKSGAFSMIEKYRDRPVEMAYIYLSAKKDAPVEIKPIKDETVVIAKAQDVLYDLSRQYLLSANAFQAQALGAQNHDSYRLLKRSAEWENVLETEDHTE